jgi:cold shock CspA family protein
MIGKVKWYNIRQCFGFIKGKDGKEVFIHKNDLPFWTIYLEPGDLVEYLPRNTNKGIQATQLKIINNTDMT